MAEIREGRYGAEPRRGVIAIVERLPKYGRIFVELSLFIERVFRRFDDRRLRTFLGARSIPMLSHRAGGHQAYADWCFHAGVYAGILSALQPGRLRILDVGCGAGEIVPGVLHAISIDSTYLGVDIDPRMIRQCREAFVDPRAQFAVVEGASPVYRPGRIDSRRPLTEICGRNEWDVILAKALFDHLSPAETERYLHLFSAGLAPDGLIIATFFLIDKPYGLISAGREGRFRFDDVHPAQRGFRYAAAFNQVPEAQLAVEAGRLDEILASAKLGIARVISGTWRDPRGRIGLDMPDTLLLVHQK
jgi:SAM-dependent methyltransferase